MKTVGLIILFLTSLVTGLYIADKARFELKNSRKVYEMLVEIKSLLRFNQPNKTELYASLRQKGYENTLKPDDMDDILKSYLERLGSRDLNSELEAVEHCIERYSLSLSKKEKDTEDKSKLAIGGGILIGTFLVVIII